MIDDDILSIYLSADTFIPISWEKDGVAIDLSAGTVVFRVENLITVQADAHPDAPLQRLLHLTPVHAGKIGRRPREFEISFTRDGFTTILGAGTIVARGIA